MSNWLSTDALLCGLLLLLGIISAVCVLGDERVAKERLPFRIVPKRIHAVEDGVFKGVIVFARKRIGIIMSLAKGELRILKDRAKHA